MTMLETKIDSELIYEGRILTLYKDDVALSNGKQAVREVIDHSEAVVVLPVSEDKVTLIKQYRYSTQEVLIEAVAGCVDEGEVTLVAAQRELAEEAGYQAAKLTHVFSGYATPGCSNELMHLYIAEDLSLYQLPPDDDENIELLELTFEEALDLLAAGKIKDLKTALILLYYKQYKCLNS